MKHSTRGEERLSIDTLRDAVNALVAMGQFPGERDDIAANDSEEEVIELLIDQRANLIKSVVRPVGHAEAIALARLFGPDGYFGLGFSLLHVIETYPGYPDEEILSAAHPEWQKTMRARLANADHR